jgi:hypothetical protein
MQGACDRRIQARLMRVFGPAAMTPADADCKLLTIYRYANALINTAGLFGHWGGSGSSSH